MKMLEIERVLLVCYGNRMGLRMGWMVIEDKGFAIDYILSKHTLTT